MSEWTEETLRKAASWKAFKEGKSLFENGAVSEAKRGSAGFQGSVAGGRKPLRVTVRILSASDLETRCPCPENQSTGALCAHAVAVGLAALSGKSAAAADPQPAVASSAPPRAWLVLFAQNWRESLQRGKLAASLAPAEATEIGLADERLAAWFSQSGLTPKPGLILNLSGVQTGTFLEAVTDHPGLVAGKDRIPLAVQSGGRIPLIESSLVAGNIRLKTDPLGGDWWDIGGGSVAVSGNLITRLGPGRGSPPDAGLLRRLVSEQACEPPLSDFLADLERWQDWLEFPPNAWLDSLHFVPAELTMELHLEGSLQHLQAQLRAKYGTAKPVPPGLGKVEGLPAVSIDCCRVRNLAAEQAAVERLASAGFEILDLAEGRWNLQGENAVVSFLAAALPELRNEWQVVEGSRFEQVQKQIAVVSPKVEILGSGEDWLSFDLKFQSSDGSAIPVEEVRRLLRSGRASGRVSGGKHLVVSPEVSDLIEPLFADLDLRQEGGHFVAKSAAGCVIQEVHKKLQKAPRQNDLGESFDAELPVSVKAELRAYQRQGVVWLQDRVTRFGGALLGDDMGLGKTLQTIALIEGLFQGAGASDSQVLVVATASLLGNWAAEFAKFAPSREVQILHGSGRDELREGLRGGQVVVTSYGTLARDLAWHLQQDYLAVVVDEASLMRNPDTDHAKAVSRLRARHRVALTGTPIENGVRDLWSIFRFVQPGWLGGREDFKARYETALASGGDARAVTERLKLKISPFFLRRTKEQVAPDLPTKLMIDEFCELSPDQQTVYKQLLEEGRRRVEEMVDSKNSGAARMRMLTALLRLRQTCCDLALLGNERFNQVIQARRSGKLQRLLELLDEAVAGGHRVLVFSQFQKQLLEIQKCVEAREWSCLRLDGQTRDRQKLVDQFQKPDGPPVFLISLKAGGYGLNLTAADTVIHFDPWWNPAAEAQATDRAHRIGQTRPVTVYRLLTRGTVEEKVLRLQAKKRDLAAVIDEAGGGDPGGWNVDDFRSVLA